MRRYVYAAVGLAVAVSLGLLIHQNAQVPPASALPSAVSAPSVVSADSTDAPPPIASPAVTLARSSEPSTIDSAEAVARAKGGWGSEILASAQVIIVGKYRFTDADVAPNIVPPNALVWIVSAHGIVMPTPGMAVMDPNPAAQSSVPRYIVHQMNFIVDANTGNVLMASASQVTPESADDARILALRSVTGAAVKQKLLSEQATNTGVK